MKLLVILPFILNCAVGSPLQRVAYDDAGNPSLQPHLVDGQDWVFKNAGDATPAARSCVFGSSIRFGYGGLKAGAAYKVRLTLFSDQPRTMRVKAGQTVLGEIKAENGKTTVEEFEIPSAARIGGNLQLIIEKITGSNAAVSEIEILSDNSAQLAILPEPKFDLPQLSPQPQKVDGVALNTLDLGGMWLFSESLPADFPPKGPFDGRIWKKVPVPGEWAMQGLAVKPGTPACYVRTFGIPDDWVGKRVKLRCDAVYSDAVVCVNGKEVGRHSGGFTPFELDLTDLVKPGLGSNILAISVLNETVADQLASGSKYACHQLGGIPRGIRLMVLPETHLGSLQVTTTFDPAFRDATLGLALEAVNEGGGLPVNLVARVSLTAPDGKAVEISPDRIAISSSSLKGAASIPVPQAVKWDSEHPMLYTLTIRLEAAGKALETITRKVGFRQIEVRGNELLVNGLPVKLRGSNHHEVYPTTGRCVPVGTHRRDIELFREGNVNLLRTCHYPPDEALMEAADELGMFIECEAPFCWAPGDGHKELVCRQTAEMVLTYRNHPSVLWWSTANESGWGKNFAASSKLVRRLDPTRPVSFSYSHNHELDFCNDHYKGHGDPARARKGYPKPIFQEEETHLNAYNRLELATDPALRDLWGRYIRELWDDIQTTKGALGQAIWSGVDDTFYMTDDRTVGYGTWGPIDGWRRTKPEYWGMKKAYSPVRIAPPELKDNTITLAVENRQNFSNMSEMKITWKCGAQSGTASTDLAPGAKGNLAIKLSTQPQPGERLELSFADPRGFIADQFSLPLLEPVKAPGPVASPGSKAQWSFDKNTGDLTEVGKLKISGPRLMILPLNNAGETQMTGKTKVWTPFTDVCANWTSSITANSPAGKTTVTAECDGAEGSYTMAFHDGGVELSYDFTITKPVNPRQVGLVFTLPHDCETFSWERQGYWDVYPEDHISRLKGTVKASEGFEATSVGPRTKPKHPWRLDNLPYGNNDFCSTKHSVLTASLTDKSGRGIVIDGSGKQHVRCWKDAQGVHVLVADYSNAGSERFLQGLVSKDFRPLKPGDTVSGCVRLGVVEK